MLRLPQEVFNGRSSNHNEAEAETRREAGEAQHEENEVELFDGAAADGLPAHAGRAERRGHSESEPTGAPFVSRAGPAPGSFL